MEAQTDGFVIVGDSAYPLSRTLLKPYPNPRGQGPDGRNLQLDPRKRAFNKALCGLR
jgi:hypothetical protein